MASLSSHRNTAQALDLQFVLPVKAGVQLFAGAIATMDGGFAAPGRTALSLMAFGRCERGIDNRLGADGDVFVTVRCGAFGWANSAGADEITLADIGKDCFIVDDQTVAKTDGGGTRSRAGRVLFVSDDDGVIVAIGPHI